MRSWLTRLRRFHLAAITLVYWVGLAAIKLTEPVLTGWRLSRLPPGQSSIEAGFTNTLLHVTMLEAGKTVWTGSIGLGSLLIWLLGPPAILIGAWWVSQQDTVTASDYAIPDSPSQPKLPASGLESVAPTRKVESDLTRRPKDHTS